MNITNHILFWIIRKLKAYVHCTIFSDVVMREEYEMVMRYNITLIAASILHKIPN